LIRNIISGLFARVVVALCNLAVLLLSTRYLGSAVVGQVSLLILNMAVIQGINEIFTGPALVYFIPRYNLRKIYATGLVWTMLSVIICNAVLFIIGAPGTFSVQHLLILSFLCSLQSFHNVVLLGNQKIGSYSFLIFLQPFLMLAALAYNLFVRDDYSLMSVLISLYASWGIALVISSARLPALMRSHAQMDFKLLPVVRNGIINQAGNLAHTLSNRFNFYILATAAAVGVYAISTSLIESVWIIGGSISPVILSRIANQRDGTNNSTLTFLLAKISFFLSAICVGVVFLLPESFYTWLLGKDFTGAKSIMMYLSPGVLSISFSTVISHYFSGLGKQRVLLLANLSGLTVTLATCYYFISTYGTVGACYATSLSYMAQATVLTILFMMKNRLGWMSVFYFRNSLRQARKAARP
jgi:O-antigen/teichoic acid export membrane protein